jgi:putative ABC transport system permease protein
MVAAFLKLSFRNLRKQKLFSFINIIGLAVGLTGFAIFALIAGLKLNADKFHENAESIYSIIQLTSTVSNEEHHTAYCPTGIKQAIVQEFPEIEDAVRIMPATKVTLRAKDESFFENHVLFVDDNFLKFFTFNMISGNPQTALSKPNSVVLTETAALKYFGDENPIGKILHLNNEKQLIVTGVTKNIPRTSSIQYEFLISLETSKTYLGDLNNFYNNNCATFVRVKDEYNKSMIEKKLPQFVNKYYSGNQQTSTKLYLFPLLDFKLKSGHIESFFRSSHIISVVLMFALGFILLLIVSINFINLSISRYMYKIKEIGIRKVIGAGKTQLVMQFMSESFLYSFIALPIAVILFDILHPIFSAYIGTPSFISATANETYSILLYPFLYKYLLITTIIIAAISGFYPAFYLSNYTPVQALSGNKHAGKSRKLRSKILIVTQFSLSIIFIAFAGIISNQFDQLMISDFGFDRNNIAAVQFSDFDKQKCELFNNEIKHNPDILSVSAAGNIPIFWFSNQSASKTNENKQNSIKINAYAVDYNFIELIGLNLVQGESLIRHKESENKFVINKSAIKNFQFENPIGEQISVNDKTGTIVGVVDDFVFGDIEFGIKPAVLYYQPEELNYFLIKYSSAATFNSVRENLKITYQEIYPNIPFNCVSLENYFADNMIFLNKIAFFLNVIGVIAIFFSCLGLLGLTSFIVEKRTKEIGIRKVLGVTLAGVIWTINKEFIILVLISNVIGLLIIYMGWSLVLQSGLLFMTPIGADTYLFVAFLSLITAGLAVTSQTLKAALANPIESLRYE